MSYTDNKLLSLFATIKRPLLVLLVTIAPVMTQYAHAGTLGGSTSFSGAWGWTFSYENIQFTRANITLDDGTIIAAPTFDITEGLDCADGATECTGSALFKGKLKVTHGPELGEAWAEMQMKWPEIQIIIDQQPVEATDPVTGETFTFIKESRIYKAVLNNGSNETKLTDGFKKIVPGTGTGVYDICNHLEDPDYTPQTYRYLCYQGIGYGTVDFDPNEIFQTIITASGQEIAPNIGFYWDEACLAFLPKDLDVQINGQDFNLKEDNDGYFRSCEGRSIAFNTCTFYPLKDTDGVFNCNDQNPDGEYFTFVLADAAAGDRLEPAPTSVCIGTNVEDWLALEAYAGSGEDLVITPCDPSQGYILFPYIFSDSSIAFTSSEGDNAVIDGLQIISIGTRSELETAVILEESADKTNSTYDFSNILLNNVSYISSLELDDTVTGSAHTDVILGGNGEDSLYGFSGDDCLDGQQNNDHLWGDSHANNHDDDTGNDREVEAGADVFVLTSKLGKDTIHDYNGLEGDVIVNVSGSSSTTLNDDGTYTVALKGQNHVTVHVEDGELNVVDQKNLSGVGIPDGVNYAQCSGHPAY